MVHQDNFNEGMVLKQHIRSFRPYVALFVIWGCQGFVSAVMQFLALWCDTAPWKPLPVVLAILASLLVVRSLLRVDLSYTFTLIKALGSRTVFSIALAIGAVWIMGYVQAVDPLSLPLLKSFVLAIGYIQLSKGLGKPFLYMGIWLFTLTAVVALKYMGFASVVLDGFGGLSMVAVGGMIHIGGRVNYRSRRKLHD